MHCDIPARPHFIRSNICGVSLRDHRAKAGVFRRHRGYRIEEHDDGSVIVTTDRGTITAKAAVIATNSPIFDMFALHTKMAPYRTYAMAFRYRARRAA